MTFFSCACVGGGALGDPTVYHCLPSVCVCVCVCARACVCVCVFGDGVINLEAARKMMLPDKQKSENKIKLD